ncbi:MAG: CBS domain-containing protein [Thermodesulfobacteriota bacterium]
MELQKTSKDMMISDFSTINRDADLKEAYEGIQKMLEESPHLPGLVVIENRGNYVGVLTLADFMNELRKLYRDACDKTEEKEWMARLFSECEIMGSRKVYEITSGKRLSIRSDESFEKACELILLKRLELLTVVDEKSMPVGIITRRQVLTEVGSRLFK